MGESGGDRGRATLAAIFEAAQDTELSAEELRLWLLYRAHEFDDGRGAFPGDERLARLMDRSPRSVQRHRASLLEAGYLEQELRGPRPARYRAVVPDEEQPVDASPEPDEPNVEDDGWPAPSDLEKDGSGGFVYPAAFEDVWAAYPDREGGNPKKAAYRKWLATVRNGADPDELLEATRIYARRMEREGNVGGRFVKQARTFFGPDDYWREELRNGAGDTAPTTDLDRQRAALDALDGGRRE